MSNQSQNVYVICEINNEKHLFKTVSHILDSKLCQLTTTILKKSELAPELIINAEINEEENLTVCNIYNDPMYIELCLQTVSDIKSMMVLHKKLHMTRYTDIVKNAVDKYIDLIPASNEMWKTLESEDDYNCKQFRVRFWDRIVNKSQDLDPEHKEISLMIHDIISKVNKIINVEPLSAVLEQCKDIFDLFQRSSKYDDLSVILKALCDSIYYAYNADGGEALEAFLSIFGAKSDDYPKIPVALDAITTIKIDDSAYPTGFPNIKRMTSPGTINLRIKSTYGLYKPLYPANYKYNEKQNFVNVVEFLYETGQNDQLIKLFACVFTSYDYCHFLLDVRVIKIISIFSVLPTFQNVIIYYMFYLFYLLVLEEKVLRERISNFHRSIISMEVACEMPFLPEKSCNIQYNPYVQMIGIDVRKKCMFYQKGDRKIVDLSTFKNRMSIYSNGALDDVDFASCNAYLTGSAMLACSAITPAEKDHSKNIEEYFEFYYPSYRRWKENCVGLSDIDIAICATSNTEFDEYAVKFFNQIKAKFSDASMTLIIKEFDVKALKGESAPEHYKYRIKSPLIGRDIDVFLIKSSIEKLIQRFHLPCVRLWYDGKTVHMFSSCVCALLSGINYEYNWISQTAKYRSIILKYMFRGYTTILSRREMEDILEYINSSSWLPAGEVPYTHKTATERFGTNHVFFTNENAFDTIMPHKYIRANEQVNTSFHHYNSPVLEYNGIKLHCYSNNRIIAPIKFN